MATTSNYESELCSVLSKEALENEIAAKIAQFQGLLTREAAIKLIAKEKGLLKAEEQRTYKIKDMPAGARKICFTAKILRILAPVVYSRGKTSRSIVLGDETGKTHLKLWPSDFGLFSKVKLGDVVEVKNAYEKNGELSLGYSGEIRVANAAPFLPLKDLALSTYVNVRGKIISIEGVGTRNKEDTNKQVFAFSISDGSSEKRCVIWEGIGKGAKLNTDDEVILENAYVKTDGLYLYNSARILVRPAKRNVAKVKDMTCEHENLMLILNDGKQLTLDRVNALKVLGANVAADITLESIVNLKKEFIVNKEISLADIIDVNKK